MPENLPEPLVAADVDLSGFSGFMLDVDRMLSSELVALCTPEEGWAAIQLWMRAWKQTPPASLPDDERVLAAFSGAGARWKKVREMALRGFVKCSDGRLYHKVLAAEANEAWSRRLKFKERSAKANQRRWSGPDGAVEQGGAPQPPKDGGQPPKPIQQGVLEGVQQGVQQVPPKESLGSPVDRTGTGTGTGTETGQGFKSEGIARAPAGEADPPPNPTPAGEACRRLKAEAGVIDVNPSHAQLLEVLAAGATPQQLVDVALEKRSAGRVPRFAFVLSTMAGRLADQQVRAALPKAQPANLFAGAK